ncbi:MAG: putative 4-mercaptohistidine N1-methyltransferase [Rickettsiales bacterium]
MNTYETHEMLNKYLLMHWGSDAEIRANVPHTDFSAPEAVHLPITCAELVVKHAANKARALDIGCAVGRSSFELARDFSEVVGIDYSREFVDSATALKTHGALEYWRRDSGDTGATLTARVDPAIDRSRIRFEQGDACALPLHLRGFDAVLMANVLCRLPDPVAALERMQGSNALVNPGGVLVLTTPFSWLAEYTPREKWLNGVPAIAAVLSEFELVETHELPFLIRDHARRFEYIITLASIWRRRG